MGQLVMVVFVVPVCGVLMSVPRSVFVSVFFPAFPCEKGKDEGADHDREHMVDQCRAEHVGQKDCER